MTLRVNPKRGGGGNVDIDLTNTSGGDPWTDAVVLFKWDPRQGKSTGQTPSTASVDNAQGIVFWASVTPDANVEAKVSATFELTGRVQLMPVAVSVYDPTLERPIRFEYAVTAR